jgi:hypothetical protein
MRKYWRVDEDGNAEPATEHDYEMQQSRSYRVGYFLGRTVPGLFIGGALACAVILAEAVFR